MTESCLENIAARRLLSHVRERIQFALAKTLKSDIVEAPQRVMADVKSAVERGIAESCNATNTGPTIDAWEPKSLSSRYIKHHYLEVVAHGEVGQERILRKFKSLRRTRVFIKRTSISGILFVDTSLLMARPVRSIQITFNICKQPCR